MFTYKLRKIKHNRDKHSCSGSPLLNLHSFHCTRHTQCHLSFNPYFIITSTAFKVFCRTNMGEYLNKEISKICKEVKKVHCLREK